MKVEAKRGKEFGEYLRTLREHKQWTLRDVEEKTGGEISNPYLSQIERGERGVPSIGILEKLAKAFDRPLEVLLQVAGYISDEAAVEAKANHVYRGYQTLSSEGRDLLVDFLELLKKRERKEEQRKRREGYTTITAYEHGLPDLYPKDLTQVKKQKKVDR